MNVLDWTNLQETQGAAVEVTSVIQGESLAMESDPCVLDLWKYYYKLKPLVLRTIDGISIADLCSQPYIFHTDSNHYFCGNDDAWSMCEGSERAWISELVDWIMKPCMDAGLNPADILNMKFKDVLTHFWAFQIFGGQFVGEGQTETCLKKSEPENLSIPF